MQTAPDLALRRRGLRTVDRKTGARIAYDENERAAAVRLERDVDRAGRVAHDICDELAEHDFSGVAIGFRRTACAQELGEPWAFPQSIGGVGRPKVPLHRATP